MAQREGHVLLPMDMDYTWKQKLQPLIITMRIWGLQLGSAKQSFWSVVIFIILHCLFIHIAAFTAMMMMTKNQPFMLVVHHIIYAFSAIVVLICYYRICYYRCTLDRSLLTLIHPSCSDYRMRRIEWRDHFRTAMYWLYCISYFLYSIWFFLMTKNIHPYYKRFVYGLNPNLFPSAIAYAIALLLQLSCIFWLRASEKLLCFFYSSVCRYISSEFNCLRRCVDDLARGQHTQHEKQKLFTCLNRYQDLCDIVSTVDVIFSSVVFLFISSLAFQITFDGNYMCKTKSFCKDPVFCLQYFLEFLIVLICFIDIFMSAASVTMEAQDIAPSVYRIASSIDTMGKDQLRPRAGLWYWKIITDPPKLSAFGSVEINRNTMISILGIVMAYVIVMYELA